MSYLLPEETEIVVEEEIAKKPIKGSYMKLAKGINKVLHTSITVPTFLFQIICAYHLFSLPNRK